jgi:hypothetical protein
MSLATLKSNRFCTADLGSIAVKFAIFLGLATVVGVTAYASLQTSVTHSF